MDNVNNVIISRLFIENLINKFSINKVIIEPKDHVLFIKAFMHKSFTNKYSFNDDCDTYSCFYFDEWILGTESNNERLEYFGDAVLYTIISEYLYDNFPDKDEKFMTNLRIKLIEKEQLCSLADKLGFREYILISSHLEKGGTRQNNVNLLENVFESFIGAVYKVFKFEITKSFILGIIKELIDMETLISIDDNFKTKLLVYFHSKSLGNPKYKLLEKTGIFN